MEPSSKPKALYGIFNDGFPPIIDGVTQTILNYVDWLRTHGYDTCVVTPYNPIKTEVPYEVIRYFSLPIRSRKPYRYGYPKLDPYIWKKLAGTPFQLIHSHSPFAAGRLGVYTKKKQGIPLIGTFHSKYKSDLKHSFKYAPFCVPIIMKRILNFYNACDEVWIPQASVEETVREYGYKGKLEVVPNGIDYGDMPIDDILTYKSEARQALGVNDNQFNLLFVGQHILSKGILIILEALKKIAGKIDFRMTYIGEGYAKEELIEAVRHSGISDKIELLPVITDRDRLGKYYAAADLFLFPSRYDNAPLVVREAASMGTPSIIPLHSTASEVITDNVNGFLADDTAEDYAQTLLRLSDDRETIRAAGLNAKKSLVRGWNDVMEEVEDRYRRLIARSEGAKVYY